MKIHRFQFWYAFSLSFFASATLFNLLKILFLLRFVVYAGMIFALVGFQIDIRIIDQKYNRFWIFRTLKYSYLFLCSLSSLILTSKMISETTGFDYSYFPISTILITAFFTLFMWAFVLSLFTISFYLIILVTSPLFFKLYEKIGLFENPGSHLVRFFLAFSISLAILTTFVFSYAFLKKTLYQSVSILDLYDFSKECMNYSKDEKVKYIGDGRILVMDKNNLEIINVRNCKPLNN